MKMETVTRMTNPENLPSIMTAREVAAFGGLNIKTVYEKYNEKKIPGVRVGRVIRFYRDDVLNWLKGDVSHSKGENHERETKGTQRPEDREKRGSMDD